LRNFEEHRVRVLLTGIAGFAGSFLAEYLVQQADVELHGIVHRHDRRIHHLLSQLTLHRGDLRNALWVSDVVETVRPDIALHLAAWSDVGGSWQQPWTTYELNIQCQLNVFEALVRWTPHCRTLAISSNEVYGLVQPGDLPIDEDTPLRPNNPYGVSKIAQDMMALQYWNSYRLPAMRARSFNHLGPGQSPEFAASAFARQIAEIEAGLRPPLVQVGNLSAQRDFTDVRDVVRAYWLLATHGVPGECYNVGSGQPRAIQWLLDTLIELSPVHVQVELDPQRLRPSDVPCSYCDPAKLAAATGWRPEIDLHTTLLDLLNSWRDQIGRREV
jgi:GDP-4-dehydro-6-deoxy-D-mannose reductase